MYCSCLKKNHKLLYFDVLGYSSSLQPYPVDPFSIISDGHTNNRASSSAV